MNQNQPEKRRGMLNGRSHRFALACCALLAGLLVACSRAAPTPTATSQPTDTATAEPTQTPSDTPEPTPTEVPGPIQELPLAWFEQNNLLELAKAAEPGVTWTTADCIQYPGQTCVTSMDLCPEGNVCEHWLVAIPVVQWSPEEYRVAYPGVVFGDEGDYTLRFWSGLENFQYTGDVVLSEEGMNQLYCMYWPKDSPKLSPEPEQWNLFVLPATDRVFEAYSAIMPTDAENPVRERQSATECGK
ncbi:MAG: hypothetical protein WEA61_06840 [Anaerolineales bacterium]